MCNNNMMAMSVPHQGAATLGKRDYPQDLQGYGHSYSVGWTDTETHSHLSSLLVSASPLFSSKVSLPDSPGLRDSVANNFNINDSLFCFSPKFSSFQELKNLLSLFNAGK